jgi:hypothetical protein
MEIGRLFEAEADAKAAGLAGGERLGLQSATQEFNYGLRGLEVREEKSNLQYGLGDIRGSLAESAQIRSRSPRLLSSRLGPKRTQVGVTADDVC